jgi:ribonuclease HII
MPTFDIENKYGKKIVAGIDEAGLGPWAGPMAVCACIIHDKRLLISGIDDSKKLSPLKREGIWAQMLNNPNFSFGTGIVTSEDIDAFGVVVAWQLCLKKAISMLKIWPDVCLIDGCRNIFLKKTKTENIIKGDQKSYSIAAASIFAKVTRDHIMKKIIHEEYPKYGFDKHVGYGTKLHMEAILTYGICKYHRKSYAPIAKLL